MNSKQNNLRFKEEFTLDFNDLHELDDDSEIQFDFNYKPDENDEDFKSQESDELILMMVIPLRLKKKLLHLEVAVKPREKENLAKFKMNIKESKVNIN